MPDGKIAVSLKPVVLAELEQMILDRCDDDEAAAALYLATAFQHFMLCLGASEEAVVELLEVGREAARDIRRLAGAPES